MNLTPAEQEQVDERVAIILESGELSEADAHRIALDGVMASLLARMSGREQARELVARLRQ